MSGSIRVDARAFDDIAGLVGVAIERAPKERARELLKTANMVRDEAAATAGSYPNGTGALAGAVRVGGSDLTRTVGADLREAFFLEFGSPSTGGPRPWLTKPAHERTNDLLDRLGAVGALW